MSLTKFSTVGAILTMGLLPNFTNATPVKNSSCASSVKVNQVPGGSGAFLNEDCTVLYILPPRKGLMTISGYQPSANLDLECSRLTKIEEDQLNLDQLLAMNSKRLVAYEKEIQDTEANLRAGLIPVGKTSKDLEDRIDTLMTRIGTIRTQVVQWQRDNDQRRLDFSKPEGGRGKFLIENTYNEMVSAYQKANPKLSVQKMVIDQSFLSVNEQKADSSNAARMPAVLSLITVGIGELPLLLDPAFLAAHKELSPHTAPAGSKLFGDALSGEIQVSNSGACALRESGANGTFSIGQVKSYVAATATYSYQVQVTRQHAITYNLQELVHQIHETVKRGGLFSSSTLNRFVDERRSDSWIDFQVSSGDTRYEYTDDYIRQVKKEFVDRALAQMVAIQTGSPAAVLALIEPGKNGASEIGDQLGKCPNLYCQIGSAGFKVLNSIFSNESAVTEMIKTFQGHASEKVTEKKMVPEYSTYTFE